MAIRIERAPDPNKVKVQMNIPISWAMNQRLDLIAYDRNISKADLVRDALEQVYPEDVTPVIEDVR